MDETLLVTQAQEGDLEAFNLLVLAYQDGAYHLGLRILHDEEAAEDAVQTAFLSSYRHLHTFRGGSFRAWLMRMVCNACYDELRRRKRRPTVPLEPVNADDEPFESSQWMVDDSLSVEDLTEQAEINRVVIRCVDELPEEFRVVVTLVDLQGLDYNEVSEAIGKPLGTVKSRLARGRQRIREELRRRVPEMFTQGFSAQAHPVIHSVEVPTF